MKTIVVAPHPDDELIVRYTLRRLHEGGVVGVVMMISINLRLLFQDIKQRRDAEIEAVRSRLGVASKDFFKLDYPATELDQVPMGILVNSLSKVFSEFQPEEVFLPCPVDVHSDHRVAFEAAGACTKRFRYPSIKRVATYETVRNRLWLIPPVPNFSKPFRGYILFQSKNDLLSIYASEFSDAPFLEACK